MGFEAVVNIGGDGSQTISQKLFEKGLPVIGVPKTIDNDLSATDLTFGFSTADFHCGGRRNLFDSGDSIFS